MTGTSTKPQFWKPPVLGTFALPNSCPVGEPLRTSIRLVVFGDAIRTRSASMFTRFTSANEIAMLSVRKPMFWLPPSGSVASS